MSTIGKNIEARLKATGMSQAQLAEKIGASQVSIHKIISGKTRRTALLPEIAAALGCTVEALVSTGTPISGGVFHEAVADYATHPRPSRKVPLVSWVRAGSWCESEDPFEPGDADEWLDSPFPVSEQAFCLRVIGDSMLADDGYREGEIILVDPAVNPRHGDDVVARTPDGKYTFKRLQITPDGTYLLALNPDHPQRKLEVPEDTHICGVVTASWTKRR